jgi:hypothetical protein
VDLPPAAANRRLIRDRGGGGWGMEKRKAGKGNNEGNSIDRGEIKYIYL